jgi:hypothetical protein
LCDSAHIANDNEVVTFLAAAWSSCREKRARRARRITPPKSSPVSRRPRLGWSPASRRWSAKPPKGDRWRHEVKWDGYRVCVVIEAGKAKLRTRRGHDWSDKFKPIAVAAASLFCHNAIIDGEAVVLDAKGRASFSMPAGDFEELGAVASNSSLNKMASLFGRPTSFSSASRRSLRGSPRRSIPAVEKRTIEGVEQGALAASGAPTCLIAPAVAKIGSKSNLSRAAPPGAGRA